MSENDDEARLRAAMEVLRKDDAARAPSFEALRARPVKRAPSALRFVAPAMGAVAMAAAVLLWVGQRRAEAPASTASAPAAVTPAVAAGGAVETAEAKPAPQLSPRRDDVAPLDFLLDTAPAAYVGSSASLDFLLEGPAR